MTLPSHITLVLCRCGFSRRSRSCGDAAKAKQPGHFSLKGKYGTTMHHLWKNVSVCAGYHIGIP